MACKAASSIEDAFLQTILQHPDDDMPRLVFADWLEEQGNPRGAFIRLQCQRAKLSPHTAEWKQLLSEESALLKQFDPEWSKPILRLVDVAHYHRGFISNIRISAARFLKNASRLFRLAPVCSVRLDKTHDLLPAIADCAFLARVQELDLVEEWVGNKPLQALVRSEHCRSLRILRLVRCLLIPSSAQILAEAANLQSLQSLSLSGNVLAEEGAQMLASSPHLIQLRELDLHANQVQTAGAIALARSAALRLVRLNISSNGIGNEGTAAIARSAQFADLCHLDLQNNAVGNLGVAALVESPYMSRLEHLNLYHNHVSSRGIQLLTDSALLANLSYLNLKSNEIDKATALTIPKRLQTPKMRELLF